MIPQPDFLVRVSCMTYNHAPYIVDAMNGFTMQQTDFPYVCTIIDDASADGEQEVIKAYLKVHFDLDDNSIAYNEETEDYVLTFARHKSNLNCYFAIIYLKYNHYNIKKSKQPYVSRWSNTKYVALCEGDDYWTDHKKLQKQVTFLEEHLEYNVCSHNFFKYFEKEDTFSNYSRYSCIFDKNQLQFYEYSLDNYFKEWYIQTLTCVYRNGGYLNNIPREKYKHYRDDIFYYYLLKQGKGVLLKDVMGVYRIHEGGVWSLTQITTKKEASIYNAYNIYLVESDKRALYLVKCQCVDLFSYQLKNKRFLLLLKTLIKYYHLFPIKLYVIILYLFFKKIVIRILRMFYT